MFRRVNVPINFGDLPFGRNHVADSFGVLRVGRLARAVGHPDLAPLITQQREVILKLIGKFSIVINAIEAATENLCVVFLEFGVQVAEPATFLRSPRRIGLRVEPQHDLLTAQIG